MLKFALGANRFAEALGWLSCTNISTSLAEQICVEFALAAKLVLLELGIVFRCETNKLCERERDREERREKREEKREKKEK